MSTQSRTVLRRYKYDSLDRLVGTDPLLQDQLELFYCKNRLATQIKGRTRHTIVQHGNQLLAQQQRDTDALDTALLATDLQRSVLGLSGPARQSFVYAPYGHRGAENGLSSLFGFNGERPDPLTGHYLLGNGYRAFNPVLMRFNSSDSGVRQVKGD